MQLIEPPATARAVQFVVACSEVSKDSRSGVPSSHDPWLQAYRRRHLRRCRK
jgi:hypothetical protein